MAGTPSLGTVLSRPFSFTEIWGFDTLTGVKRKRSKLEKDLGIQAKSHEAVWGKAPLLARRDQHAPVSSKFIYAFCRTGNLGTRLFGQYTAKSDGTLLFTAGDDCLAKDLGKRPADTLGGPLLALPHTVNGDRIAYFFVVARLELTREAIGRLLSSKPAALPWLDLASDDVFERDKKTGRWFLPVLDPISVAFNLHRVYERACNLFLLYTQELSTPLPDGASEQQRSRHKASVDEPRNAKTRQRMLAYSLGQILKAVSVQNPSIINDIQGATLHAVVDGYEKRRNFFLQQRERAGAALCRYLISEVFNAVELWYREPAGSQTRAIEVAYYHDWITVIGRCHTRISECAAGEQLLQTIVTLVEAVEAKSTQLTTQQGERVYLWSEYAIPRQEGAPKMPKRVFSTLRKTNQTAQAAVQLLAEVLPRFVRKRVSAAVALSVAKSDALHEAAKTAALAEQRLEAIRKRVNDIAEVEVFSLRDPERFVADNARQLRRQAELNLEAARDLQSDAEKASRAARQRQEEVQTRLRRWETSAENIRSGPLIGVLTTLRCMAEFANVGWALIDHMSKSVDQHTWRDHVILAGKVSSFIDLFFVPRWKKPLAAARAPYDALAKAGVKAKAPSWLVFQERALRTFGVLSAVGDLVSALNEMDLARRRGTEEQYGQGLVAIGSLLGIGAKAAAAGPVVGLLVLLLVGTGWAITTLCSASNLELFVRNSYFGASPYGRGDPSWAYKPYSEWRDSKEGLVWQLATLFNLIARFSVKAYSLAGVEISLTYYMPGWKLMIAFDFVHPGGRKEKGGVAFEVELGDVEDGLKSTKTGVPEYLRKYPTARVFLPQQKRSGSITSVRAELKSLGLEVPCEGQLWCRVWLEYRPQHADGTPDQARALVGDQSKPVSVDRITIPPRGRKGADGACVKYLLWPAKPGFWIQNTETISSLPDDREEMRLYDT